jgi:predicted nucleic acid-binding protein
MHLLDTNVLSELIRLRPDPRVESRFETEPADLFTPVICLEEIRYGAKIGPPGNKLWERSQAEVFPRLTVLPLDEASAIAAADLRAEWKMNGTPVGYRDGLLAATAKGPKALGADRGFDSQLNRFGLNEQKIFNAVCPRSPGQLRSGTVPGNSSACSGGGRKPKAASAL